MQFSEKVKNIGPASSIELNERVYQLLEQGSNPIILSYGEAPFKFTGFDFSTLDCNSGAHYSDSRGIKTLRTRVISYYNDKYNSNLSENNIIITAGSKIACFIAFSAILNPGDNIFLHEPSWVSYQEHAKLCDAQTHFIPYDQNVEGFDKYFEESKCRALILNNPNNPRGYKYSESELRYCADLCKKNGSYLIVDESYSDFVEGNLFFSATKLLDHYENIIVINSFSKNFGLSGWRVGYLIADEKFINQALKINQHLITCAPTILQMYLNLNFESLMSSIQTQMNSLMSKRELVRRLLDKYSFKYLTGDSTFYFFIDLEHLIVDAKDFCLTFLEEDNVALIPGNAYGSDMKSFVRLSFGVETIDRIELGLRLLRKRIGSH